MVIFLLIIMLECIFFLFIAYKIHKNKKSRIETTVAFMFLVPGFGLFLNLIRLSFRLNSEFFLLNIPIVFYWLLSLFFGLLFTLDLYGIETMKKIKTLGFKRKTVFLISYALFISLLLILQISFYIIAILITILMILNLVLNIKIIISIFDIKIKKRFLLYTFGVLGLYFVCYSTVLNSWFLSSVLRRSILSVVSMSSGYLIYHGIFKPV